MDPRADFPRDRLTPSGTMVALEGLGDANVTAGRFAAAEQAFMEGMVTADKMGMTKDMLGMMAKIA